MCRAEPAKAKIIKDCLDKYYSWLGQALNADKSNILFSKSTPRFDRRLIKDTLGFKDMGSKAIYLGNSLVLGRKKSKEFFRLKEKVNCKLEGWNKHLLSKAEKATLIKSVVQAIPSYTMTTHLLPTALKAWKDICKPKDLGGLGFRRFKDMNLSLLAKIGWKLANGEDCLWTQTFRVKYLQNSTFFGYKEKKGAPSVWQGLTKVRKILRKGSCYHLGDGSSIDIWQDPWLPNLPNKTPTAMEFLDTINRRRVFELWDETRTCWNESLIRQICDTESA
ncbi:hypothetical protein FEM48_Zijuj02G0176000 [Ziziphus jujuba var. spinosa]|uniref:Reverse transcriptase n=1 Tax=Ziziphus jujuba var. spinosa TaxID=714518 RepID=A0A978VX15_ZIZJJ|nr:hypothetical protein FEM48_Zijuj02G0176000 [Ziziphus jujuba var. spinosa]